MIISKKVIKTEPAFKGFCGFLLHGRQVSNLIAIDRPVEEKKEKPAESGEETKKPQPQRRRKPAAKK